MDATLKSSVEEKLGLQFNQPVKINNSKPVSGGCINKAQILDTSKGDFFIKWNFKKPFIDLFEKEVNGLKTLADSKSIRIPQVITQGFNDENIFLILEFIPESGTKDLNFWTGFGQQLACLHKQTDPYFGLDHNNYIGPLEQSNKQHFNWIEFYVMERLEPQIKIAREKKFIDPNTLIRFSGFISKLHELIPVEKPSLLHGDLWSGNYLINKNQPVLIDPAVYYGNREMDLAMTILFGGFDQQFYDSYNENFPLEKGWPSRAKYHQLYPLLVHLNLFGASYLKDINAIISRF